jgi:two-component sensor histidine kinase
MISSLINLKDASLGEEVDLSDIIHQIEAIRIIHEKLYMSEDVSHIEIHEYVQQLLGTIFRTFTEITVHVENRIEEIELETRDAISVGLIINEIATNAIKHGFDRDQEARFTVEMKRVEEGGSYLLQVINTGNRFPDEIDFSHAKTLGLRLISILVSQLDGSLELEREPHTTFRIRIPVEHEEP